MRTFLASLIMLPMLAAVGILLGVLAGFGIITKDQPDEIED